MSISKYSNTDLIEDDGYRILLNHLSTSEFKLHIDAGKIPNYDGRMEVLDNQKPVGHFFFQVKTTEHIKYNKDGYAIFDLKTNFIDYIRSRITNDIGIYFIIDKLNDKVLFLVLDKDNLDKIYYKDGQENVRYKFNKFNELNNAKDFKNILLKSKKESNVDSIYEIYSHEEIEELQTSVDSINQIFSTDLKFIKDTIFPDVWKFRIKFSLVDNMKGFALSKIKKGENDSSVGALDSKCFEELKNDELYKAYHFDDKDLSRNIDEFKKDVLHKIADQYFETFLYVDLFDNDTIIEKVSSRYRKGIVINIEKELQNIFNTSFPSKSSIELIVLLKTLHERGVYTIEGRLPNHSQDNINNKFSKISSLYTGIMNAAKIPLSQWENGLYSYRIDYDEEKTYPMMCWAMFLKEKSDSLDFINKNSLTRDDFMNNKNKYQNAHFSLSYVDMIKDDAIMYDMLLALLKSTVYRIIGDKVEYNDFIQ